MKVWREGSQNLSSSKKRQESTGGRDKERRWKRMEWEIRWRNRSRKGWVRYRLTWLEAEDVGEAIKKAVKPTADDWELVGATSLLGVRVPGEDRSEKYEVEWQEPRERGT